MESGGRFSPYPMPLNSKVKLPARSKHFGYYIHKFYYYYLVVIDLRIRENHNIALGLISIRNYEV